VLDFPSEQSSIVPLEILWDAPSYFSSEQWLVKPWEFPWDVLWEPELTSPNR